MRSITVVPAYNRDYKTEEQVRKAWDEDRDFRIQDIVHPDNGRYLNKQDVAHGETIKIRYNKQTEICLIKT